MEFETWGKTPRLFKNCVITEKIDGTNGAIVIEAAPAVWDWDEGVAENTIDCVTVDGVDYFIGAQSRNRLLTPGKDTDNAGFASWVEFNAEALVSLLGPGRHFGEWWGNGIQRGYGLEKGDKRFSLFNTKRWGHYCDPEQAPNILGLGVVPVIDIGTFNSFYIKDALEMLGETGSYAAPGFMEPEGIIVYHTAINQVFKVTFENDGGKWTAIEEAA